jgi:hypothetical protein
MKDNKKKDAPVETLNLQEETLIDLPVADEQAEEARGGAEPHIKVFSGSC